MNSPLSDGLAGRPVSPSMRDATQQQTVQRILERAPSAGVNVSGTASEVRRDEVLKATDQINTALRAYDVQFEVSDEANRVITRIVDQETGDVIRQIPPEAALEIAQRLEEIQQGLLLDNQA